MQNKIRKELFKLRDEKFRDFHSKLCPGIENIIGIRVPILKRYAREIVKEGYSEYLHTAKSDYYEEIMLQGLVINFAKIDIEEKVKYAEEFIPKINNWAICDTFCAGLKIKERDLPYIWNFINTYLEKEGEFEKRFGIVMMTFYYINEEYIDKVIKNINYIKDKRYYVQMSIAWCISICYIKFKEKTLDYLNDNKLDDFTYNKALQKCIESNRVNKKEKEDLKKMKRK